MWWENGIGGCPRYAVAVVCCCGGGKEQEEEEH